MASPEDRPRIASDTPTVEQGAGGTASPSDRRAIVPESALRHAVRQLLSDVEAMLASPARRDEATARRHMDAVRRLLDQADPETPGGTSVAAPPDASGDRTIQDDLQRSMR
jgi:hypothetical protein